MNKETTYFWAPNVNWIVNDNSLVIGECVFSIEYALLFPKIYFLFQTGISIDMLCDTFSDFPKIKFIRFIKKLIELNILISNVQDTHDIFYGQKNCLKNYTRKRGIRRFHFDPSSRLFKLEVC